MIKTSINIRYPDCDSMGIVHHAVYPVWYEIARMDFFKKAGFPWELMNEKKIDPAMVNLDLNYLSPLHYPGEVEIRTSLVLLDGKKIKLQYECWQGNCCSNKASSFHIWTIRESSNFNNLKSINLSEEEPEIYSKLKNFITE